MSTESTFDQSDTHLIQPLYFHLENLVEACYALQLAHNTLVSDWDQSSPSQRKNLEHVIERTSYSAREACYYINQKLPESSYSDQSIRGNMLAEVMSLLGGLITDQRFLALEQVLAHLGTYCAAAPI